MSMQYRRVVHGLQIVVARLICINWTLEFKQQGARVDGTTPVLTRQNIKNISESFLCEMCGIQTTNIRNIVTNDTCTILLNSPQTAPFTFPIHLCHSVFS